MVMIGLLVARTARHKSFIVTHSVDDNSDQQAHPRRLDDGLPVRGDTAELTTFEFNLCQGNNGSDSLRPRQQCFSYVETGLPGLTQFKAEDKVSCSASDEVRTRDP